MRRRYILNPDPGAPAGSRLVEVRDSMPEPQLHVISDHIEPFKSMADGRDYESKSEYRRSLKERGLVEMGNDKPSPQPYKPLQDWGDAIHRAMSDRGL